MQDQSKTQPNEQVEQNKEKQNENKSSWWKWFLAGIGTVITAIIAFLFGRRRQRSVSNIKESADTVGKQLESAQSGIKSAEATVQSIGESINDSEKSLGQLNDSVSKSEGVVQQLTDSVDKQSELIRDSQSIIDAVKGQHK